MPRYLITVEYDGGPFVGWQRQDNGPSVQGALEEALKKLTGAAVLVQGAGRTDAGVHALGQAAHFDLARAWPAYKIRDGLNYHLRPAPVAVLEAREVADDFHARFSAVKRHYLYRILNRRAPPAVMRGKVWHVPVPLDEAAMHAAAQALAGLHDFTTFRASRCQAKSPVRDIGEIAVTRKGEEIHLRVSARSFLHNQIRSIAGSLKLVGEGRWAVEDIGRALAARDRKACGPVAPPEGLYLTRVDY